MICLCVLPPPLVRGIFFFCYFGRSCFFFVFFSSFQFVWILCILPSLSVLLVAAIFLFVLLSSFPIQVLYFCSDSFVGCLFWQWLVLLLHGLTHSVFWCYHYFTTRRCPWCTGYRRRKWTWWHEFKSWTRLIAFHIALIPLGKVWIQLFSLQLWVNSRAD